jgi:hypothetical protein
MSWLLATNCNVTHAGMIGTGSILDVCRTASLLWHVQVQPHSFGLEPRLMHCCHLLQQPVATAIQQAYTSSALLQQLCTWRERLRCLTVSRSTCRCVSSCVHPAHDAECRSLPWVPYTKYIHLIWKINITQAWDSWSSFTALACPAF